jgi:hypothetical protein
MTSFILQREGMTCDVVILKIIKRCFENSLGSHTLLVWCDFCVVGFLERKAMPVKVYKSFGNKNIIFILPFLSLIFFNLSIEFLNFKIIYQSNFLDVSN